MKLKFNEETKIKIIGLLTILIGLWLVLYFIPELFVSLFNSLLGNLILIISTTLVFMNNRTYGLILGLIILVLYRFSRFSKEGFDLNISGTFNIDKESQQQKQQQKQQQQQQQQKQQQQKQQQEDMNNDFLRIQSTINRNKVFDMNTINSQASQEELAYFNKNGKWPWSQEVIKLFEEAINRNPYIRTLPGIATERARTIYNQAAIISVLITQTKEGQFLLNGVLVKDPSGNKMEELPSGFGNFPYESGLLGNRVDDIIKCNSNPKPKLERIRYTGKGGIFGEQTEKVTPVDYNDLENIIPGFKFLNKPCNPCGALQENPDYSCTYRLRVKDKPPFISSIWQYLWGINDNPLESQPSFLSESINPNEFPLLSELQSELQKQNSYNL